MPEAKKRAKRTRFGRFLHGLGLEDPEGELAGAIGLSKGYVHQLCVELDECSPRVAARIASWAAKRGTPYPIESWPSIKDAIRKFEQASKQEVAPSPQEASAFGRHLAAKNITFREAAAALGCSRQYLHQVATMKQKISLPMAIKIVAWSRKTGGDVPLESWGQDWGMEKAKG